MGCLRDQAAGPSSKHAAEPLRPQLRNAFTGNVFPMMPRSQTVLVYVLDVL
jgi:hypothetical protein